MSSSSPVRIVFMGSDEIALPVLEGLLEEKDRVLIDRVYTQPDRARGRGKKVQANAIKAWAIENEISVFQPGKFDNESIEELTSCIPDLILVMAYGHLLPQPVLDLPPLGIYNLHTSLLPKLRGASPIETAVATGMTESGVSLMKLVLKMDAGPICDCEPVPIEENETGGSYREKLAAACQRVLLRNLQTMLTGTIETIEQDESSANYCRILVKQDGQLDYQSSAETLAHRINGLNPWPGGVAELDGVKLKVGLATWSNDPFEESPGTVIESGPNSIQVATSIGILHYLKLQKPGGRMLPVETFLRGNPIKKGEQFRSQEMHPLVSMKPVSHKRVFHLYQKP